MKIMLFIAMDINSDYSEFKKICEATAGESADEEQVKNAFAQLDENGDGFISLSELLRLAE